VNGRPGRQPVSEINQAVGMANAKFSAIETLEKNNRVANHCSFEQPQENAATVAPRDGVQKHKKRDISCGNISPKTQSNAMSLYAKETHIRLSKAIGFALTLGTSKAWEGLSLILVARLSKAERAALAYSALISLDDETAYRTASVALFGVMNGEALQ